MTSFYHVCFVVPDLEYAMSEFASAVDIRWNEPKARTLGDWHFRMCISREFPYVELIQGEPREVDGCPLGRAFAYHRADHILGGRIEVLDRSLQEGFLQEWDPAGSAMPALDPRR
ncbi:hypothetical protein [Nocardia wallacei]|uniref:hypothetical protein n=1 Tax=Nocardia wallacei TaxID=480035 RepID=UPI002453DCEA|nr:hypothetical protein [Nocardia wallacei]